MNDGMLDVRKLGAAGDGRADDTAAIQRALDGAASGGGAVFVPPGTYLCSTLHLRPHVAIVGVPAWGFRTPGGSILRLADEKARCLLDLAGATGATVEGLSLEGLRLGDGVHGLLLDKPDYGQQEDAFRIDRCRVAGFTGDALRLGRVWCFSVRHSMLCNSRGNGISLHGWDGFLVDNWLSCNLGAGLSGSEEANSSCTIVGNRIECNRAGGVVLRGGRNYNLTGNYFDYCGGSGLALLPRADRNCEHVSVTGNVFYRSGCYDGRPAEENAHIRIEGGGGIAVVGNTLTAGIFPEHGRWGPERAIVCRGLTDSVIKDNVLHCAAMRELLADAGGHGPGVVIADNPGSLMVPEA